MSLGAHANCEAGGIELGVCSAGFAGDAETACWWLWDECGTAPAMM
jgi:hypothetical protein